MRYASCEQVFREISFSCFTGPLIPFPVPIRSRFGQRLWQTNQDSIKCGYIPDNLGEHKSFFNAVNGFRGFGGCRISRETALKFARYFDSPQFRTRPFEYNVMDNGRQA
jgi:hypothetical protein